MSDLSAERKAALIESLAPEMYQRLMEATVDSWRQWRYLNDGGKERHRADAAEIITDALAPLLAEWSAQDRAEAVAQVDRVRRWVVPAGYAGGPEGTPLTAVMVRLDDLRAALTQGGER